jgi:hypothetical protein
MTNVVANNVALGSEPGQKLLYLHGASFIRRPGARGDTVLVDVNTIDNYINNKGIEYVDFVKIDTEGWEYEIVKGAFNSLLKISHIQYEYGGTWRDGGYRMQQMADLLNPYGYEIFDIIPNGLVKVNDFNDHFNYHNYLATRMPSIIQEIVR